MAIYDAASAIQQPNIVGAYQQGLIFRNALADLAAKRAEEQRQIEIRNGLAQFYRQAQPERREQVPQGMSLLDMASMGAAGPGQLANSPMPSGLSPLGRLPNDGFGRVQSAGMIPTTQERTIPATPASFDFEGAQNWLASRGEIEQSGALAQLREKMRPASAKYYGGDAQEVIGQDGKRRLIAMTEAGPVELPYQPVSKPKYKFMDDGTVVDETSMQVVGRIPVGLSPKELLQARIAFASQNKPQAITGADGQVYWVSPGQQLPPGVKSASGASTATPSEDERKAAGWLEQMNKAARDMREAMRLNPDSAKPGFVESLPLVPEAAKNMSRSPARQKFLQGASSFAEAALRMATGAGINESEAKQKVAELTPQWGDSDAVIAQKWESLRMYIESARARAGRAAGSAAQATAPAPVPAPAKPTAPGQKPSLDAIFGGRR